MKKAYTTALLELLQTGLPIDKALAGLRRTLESKGHGKLLIPILHELVRVLEAEKGIGVAVITLASASERVALKAQMVTALAELGVAGDVPVTAAVDETLIGGFVATFNNRERDHSHKRVLKSLYESITA